MTRQLSIILFVPLLVIFVLSPLTSYASPSSSVVINEIMLDGTTTKYEEFIELAVIGPSPVSLDGWTLKVKNISGSECTVANPFVLNLPDVILAPTDTFLMASQKDDTQYFVDAMPDMYYLPCSGSASVLAAEKLISLYDDYDVLVDEVHVSNQPAYTSLNPISYDSVAQKGMSFERTLDSITGKPIDTDNSLQDFATLTVPTPGVLATLPDPPESPPVDPPPAEDPDIPPADEPLADDPAPAESPPDTPPAVIPPAYLPILLNELYIDPVSPQTDAQDEWVELYNPNDTAQDLGGYTIYTGESYSYHHTFTAGTVILPHDYIVVTSGESSLALANGAGAAKIVGPDMTVYATTSYESAPTGQAWAKDSDGIFKWTTITTEGSANTIYEPVPVAITKAAVAAKKSSVTKVAAAKTTAKTTAPKITASKSSKLKVTSAVEGAALVAAPSPLPTSLLAGLGLLAVLYSAYEYRFELANKIYQFRQYRKHRAHNRR